MTKEEIREAVRLLEKERREFMQQAMNAFDAEQLEKYAAIRKQCQHEWRLSETSPDGNRWFVCSICSATKVEVKGGDAE